MFRETRLLLLGMAFASASLSARAHATVKVDDGNAAWSWSGMQAIDDSSAYNGTAHASNVKGATGQIAFTGTTLQIYGWTGPDGGKMQIYVDGALKTTVNEYSRRNRYGVQIYAVSGLARGSHTLKLITQGGGWAMVDDIIVGGLPTTPTPTPTPTVTPTPSPTPTPIPGGVNNFLSDTAKYSATTYRDLKYGSDSRQILDLYVPKVTGQTVPIVVFIHGGGWIAGYKTGDDTLDTFRAAIVARGAAFANLEYRLATTSNGVQMADIVADVKGALRFLKAKASTYGLNPDYVVVMGESAGGHLSSFLATTQKNPTFEGTIGGNAGQYPTIRGLVHMYGPTDLLALSNDWAVSKAGGDITEYLDYWLFAGCASISACQTQFSPVTQVSADDPPALILQGGADDLVPPSQSEALNAALQNVGVKSKLVIYPDEGHEFDVKNSDFSLVYGFIKNVLQSKAPF